MSSTKIHQRIDFYESLPTSNYPLNDYDDDCEEGQTTTTASHSLHLTIQVLINYQRQNTVLDRKQNGYFEPMSSEGTRFSASTTHDENPRYFFKQFHRKPFATNQQEHPFEDLGFPTKKGPISSAEYLLPKIVLSL